jgi:PBP1b-binding outer membrane lipoprotein LpoB
MARRPRLLIRPCPATTAAALLLLVPIILAGCAAAGALAYKTVGPPAIDAEFVPPKVPTLVLVENARLPAAGIAGSSIARDICDQFERYNIAPTIEADRVESLRMKDPKAYREMSMTAIGRAVGAEQVLYVHLEQYTVRMTEGSNLLRGTAMAHVRLVNVKTGETMWPTDSVTGHPIAAETPYASLNDAANESGVRMALNKILAIEIGRLFRKWKPDEVVE